MKRGREVGSDLERELTLILHQIERLPVFRIKGRLTDPTLIRKDLTIKILEGRISQEQREQVERRIKEREKARALASQGEADGHE